MLAKIATVCSFNKRGDKGMIRAPRSLGSKLLLFFKIQLRGRSTVNFSKRTFPCLWPEVGASGAPIDTCWTSQGIELSLLSLLPLVCFSSQPMSPVLLISVFHKVQERAQHGSFY